MQDEIRQFDYLYVVVDSDTSQAAGVVEAVWEAGIDLLAFSSFPNGEGKTQLDLITDNASLLAKRAHDLGLRLRDKKTGVLIRSQNRPGAIADVLNRLSDAGIRVISLQAIPAGEGRFGALVWVEPPDVPLAMRALEASISPDEVLDDIVTEASMESFPASDSPAWMLDRLA